MKKKNVFDKFLDFYEDKSNEVKEYEQIYVKPSKVKSGIMFSITFILLILIVRYLFGFNLIFFLMFFIDLLICAYYGYNLFSKKGIALRKTVVKKEK